MQFGEDADLCPQQLRDDRHRYIVNRPALVALDAINICQMHCRDEDDGSLLKTRMLPDHFGKLKAIKVRHAHVHQHHGNVSLQELLKGLFPRRSFEQVLSQFAQNDFITEQLGRLVVHHQDVDLIVFVHSSTRANQVFRLYGVASLAYRCSHIRSADRSCSVFTGLARYSEAPASRHFSRSPFIALAVSAMIGSRRNAGFSRITCIVWYPSISGIIMSIRTIAISGVDSSMATASRPVPAVRTDIPRRSNTLLSAKMFRTSSSTTNTFLPTSASSDRCRRSSIFCFSAGRCATTRCRKRAVSSSSRSGDSTPFTTTLRASVWSRVSSSGDSSLPVNTTTGNSLSDAVSRILSRISNPDRSGRRRSSTMQSNVSRSSTSRASAPVVAAMMSTSS